jgi:ferredoxin
MDNNPTPPAEDKEVIIGKYKVKVIRSLCIGAGSCIAVSGNIFKFDGENKAIIQEGGQDSPENILMAAQSCPTKAIIVIDTETNQQVWPA